MEDFSTRVLTLLILHIASIHLLSAQELVSPPTPAVGITTYKRDLVEPPVMVKIICTISYDVVRSYMNDSFAAELTKSLSALFGAGPGRISNVEITPDVRGRTVVTFKLTSGGATFVSNSVALNFFGLTEKSKIYMTVYGVTLSPVIQYCNWTEGGCPMNDQCVASCKSEPERNLYPLLVLLVIPLVVVIALVLVWYCKYKKPAEKTRIDLTELGYVENRSKFGHTLASRKGTISGMSLADNSVRNKVYTIMGQKYGFSIDNADFYDGDDVKDIP